MGRGVGSTRAWGRHGCLPVLANGRPHPRSCNYSQRRSSRPFEARSRLGAPNNPPRAATLCVTGLEDDAPEEKGRARVRRENAQPCPRPDGEILKPSCRLDGESSSHRGKPAQPLGPQWIGHKLGDDREGEQDAEDHSYCPGRIPDDGRHPEREKRNKSEIEDGANSGSRVGSSANDITG